MKILLISPSSGKWHGIGKNKIFNGKIFRFSMLSLLTVAALTPKEHEITIIDEQVEDIPFNEDFDLIGITTMTATAPRAYQIARIFRDKNIPVVMGGFHPTFNSKEVLQHANSVVIGPAYEAWENLLQDLLKNNLKKIYHGNPNKNIPKILPRYLLNKKNYVTVNATYATLGCTNNCRYCSINSFHKNNRYYRNAEDVANEIKNFKEKFFVMVDDNLTQDREYCINLLKKLVPLKKKWITQASIEIADDNELLQMLKEAGCIGLFIGLETFSEKALNDYNKTIKSPLRYKELVKKIHKKGIFIDSGIMFGFDTDNPDVFESTLKVIEKIGIDAIQVSIVTPLPGTPLFKDMKNKIFDFNWEHYDFKNAVFTPKNMSAKDLTYGAQWVRRKFYSPLKIIKRIFKWLTFPGGIYNILYPIVCNVAYWGRLGKFKIKGYNPNKINNKSIHNNLKLKYAI